MLDAEEAYQQYRDMVYGYLIRLCAYTAEQNHLDRRN